VSKREQLPEFTKTQAPRSHRAANDEFWAAQAQTKQNQGEVLSPQVVLSPHFKCFCNDREGTTLRTYFARYLRTLPPDDDLEKYYLYYSDHGLLAISNSKDSQQVGFGHESVLIIQYSMREAEIASPTTQHR